MRHKGGRVGVRERWRWQSSVASDLHPVCARENVCSAEFGEGERQQVGVLEGRAAREPASIVFCFRWVSPHREGTDSMRFLLRAGEKSGSAVV